MEQHKIKCYNCDRLFDKKTSMISHNTHHFKNAEFYKTKLNAGAKKGSKFTEEHKQNLRKSLIGRKLTPEQCKQNSERQKGKKLSEETKKKIGLATKGKTYEEIFKSKEKAIERKKKASAWMKTSKNIRKYSTKISKPQMKLYEKIKSIYPDAILEYPIKINDRTIWLDIAVVSLKLNFEYDGSYWHNINNQYHIRNDEQRDKILSDLGWKIKRYNENNLSEICC